MATASAASLAAATPASIDAPQNGFNDATTDPEQILSRWKQWQHANIGLVSGPVSSRLVLDFDDSEGEASFRKPEVQRGRLTATSSVMTDCGRHVYFKFWGAL